MKLTLFILLLWPFAATAQLTAPAPLRTPDTAKPRYTLKTLKIEPVTIFQMDDAASIDVKKQFPGIQPLPDSCHYSGETHLKDIRQISFEGENAEAYLSFDEQHLSFQAHGTKPNTCDQIYSMTLAGSDVTRISTGKGHTTCSYYYPSGDTILYASTHEFYGGSCPAPPDMSKGYVWALYHHNIYLADTNGKQIGQLTNDSFYNAEATISPKGDRIVFTSTRSGDLELWSMKLDGSDKKQLTHEEGYDGGAFYSPDGKEIVYRGDHPKGEALTEYRDLLHQGLVKPTHMELWVMNADGSHKHQVTHLDGASFAPYFLPDGKRIIFASNFKDPKKRAFDLFIINKDGSGIEQVTHGGGFNSFPMFTRDGKHLIFCSNRNGSHPHNTNIFIADWVE